MMYTIKAMKSIKLWGVMKMFNKKRHFNVLIMGTNLKEWHLDKELEESISPFLMDHCGITENVDTEVGLSLTGDVL